MAYLYLGAAIAGELIGTSFLKYSNGFTKLTPTLISLLAYGACFYFLAKSLNGINLSVAYASWSGLGIVAATLLSLYLFNEQLNLVGVFGIGLVLVGVVVLNLFGTGH